MQIVYSSDENYAQHMAVSMVSLFTTNNKVDSLTVYVISNGITDETKEKLNNLAESYQRKIVWIDFKPYAQKLLLNMEWHISLSSYARLFIAEMLSDECERAIYLDCDTIICNDLTKLWEMDMKEHSVAGVLDLVRNDFEVRVGMCEEQPYINAGVLLINLKKWRETSIQDKLLGFIVEREGRVTHHDQGVINGVLNSDMLKLPPEYNVMTPFFTFKYKKLVSFFDLKNYYTSEDINFAVTNPAIIHFTPEFVGRVWEIGCRHPKKNLYIENLDKTCWKGNIGKAQPLPFKLKLLYWMYKNLPIVILNSIPRLRKK